MIKFAMKSMHNALSKQTAIEVQKGMTYVRIHDLIIFSDSLHRGWNLLLLLCTFVLPSDNLSPYLHTHLTTSAASKREHWELAEACEERLKRNQANPRKLPPTEDEILATVNQGKQVFKVWFTDGSSKTFALESHTTCRDILKQCFTKFGIENHEEYSLYDALQPGDFCKTNLYTVND